MGQTLTEIAQTLKDANKKVQLIYAFNGTGKTRLSREFKELISPKNPEGAEDGEDDDKTKVLYYNAFTEDLFYWDNDLDYDTDRKLKIKHNNYNKLVLVAQAHDLKITTLFQRETKKHRTPRFNVECSVLLKENKKIRVPE